MNGLELQFGKGALKTPKEVRDRHFRLSAQAPRVIDWNKPFNVESGFTLKQRNQKSSSSCTGQATCYYAEALNRLEVNKEENYSARFNYSQSFEPGGGAYIWKAMSIPLKSGVASQSSVPDEDSTEETMTDSSLNSQALIEAVTDKYAVIPRSNIDQLAGVIEDFHGFVTGFNGNNSMFLSDGTCNIPTSADWGHAVYVCGYEMHNSKKCLKFKNSWSDLWGSNGYGYFPEEFVNSGYMFDCYTYADITDLDPTSVMLTEKQVKQLQALEGYNDPEGVKFWTGKLLSDYLNARLPDKIKTINESL